MEQKFKTINYYALIISIVSFELLVIITWINHDFTLAFTLFLIGFFVSTILFIGNQTLLLKESMKCGNQRGLYYFRKSLITASIILFLFMSVLIPMNKYHEDLIMRYSYIANEFFRQIGTNLAIFFFLTFLILPLIDKLLFTLLKQSGSYKPFHFLNKIHITLIYQLKHFGYLLIVLYIFYTKDITGNHNLYVYILLFMLALYDGLKIYQKSFIQLHISRLLVIGVLIIMQFNFNIQALIVSYAVMLLIVLLYSVYTVILEFLKISKETRKSKIEFFEVGLSVLTFSLSILALIMYIFVDFDIKLLLYLFVFIDFLLRVVKMILLKYIGE